jgi:hypothetical protein
MRRGRRGPRRGAGMNACCGTAGPRLRAAGGDAVPHPAGQRRGVRVSPRPPGACPLCSSHRGVPGAGWASPANVNERYARAAAVRRRFGPGSVLVREALLLDAEGTVRDAPHKILPRLVRGALARACDAQTLRAALRLEPTTRCCTRCLTTSWCGR